MKKEFTLKTFKRMIGKVVEWNEIGGNSVEDTSLIPVYIQLSREEFYGQSEFLQGWFTGDKEMQADGVGDLLFVYGFLCELMKDNSVYSNDEELDSHNEAEIIDHLSANLIHGDENYEALYTFCRKMSHHMDIEAVFNRVHTSNLSKFVHESVLLEGFCLDGEVQHIESQGRYSGVDWKQVGEYFVFTARQDVQSGVVFNTPKVVKSSRFVDVEELGGLLEFVY